MYEGLAFPTHQMIDQKWSIEQITGHSEFGVRVVMIKEQCRKYGFNFGVETITTGNFIRVLYVLNKLPNDILASLKESVFWLSEEGEKKSCL